MIRAHLIKGALMLLTFLISNQVLAANEDSACLLELNDLRNHYAQIDRQMTVSVADSQGMTLYRLLHVYKDAKNISYWENLNGEIRGYALKGDIGFDFNQDKEYAGPLTWHQTLIWDRLLNPNTKLNGFSCVLTGRTRIAGKKATLIRLASQDSYRYSYLIAKDDDSSLPVELSILSPNSGIVSKMTVTAADAASGLNLDLTVFDKLETKEKGQDKTQVISAVWPELFIPKEYKLVDSGEIYDKDQTIPYQLFSDGLTTFRVYKNRAGSLVLPALTNGTISILRKTSAGIEYAVVGEIPLLFAETVLSRLPN